MQHIEFKDIPGLFLFADFFSAQQREKITYDSIALHDRLEKFVSNSRMVKARIPQPEFVRSARHNLASEEYYIRVVLKEQANREIRCEYFPRYGEDGHALAYFRGNNNLPDFVVKNLLSPMRSLIKTLGLSDPDRDLEWKLTINFYKNMGGTVAGFPFHVDLPANGVVTMILNVQRESLLQMAKDDIIVDVQLPVGGLIILSGESRYAWKHRVLPMTGDTGGEEKIERVSVVLGFQ